MNEDIVLNIDFEGYTPSTYNFNLESIQVVPSTIAWEDFELMLKVFSDQEEILVRYIDEDKDEVIISSQEELTEGFKEAKKRNNSLLLKVKCIKTARDDRRSPEQEDIVRANVKEQLENIIKKPTYPPSGSEMDNPIVIETESPPFSRVTELDSGEASSSSDLKWEDNEVVQYFYLRNQATGLVLDVKCFDMRPGSKVIVYHQKPDDMAIENQLWYDDYTTGTIRSVATHFCLDVEDGKVLMQPFVAGKESQQWSIREGKVQCRFNSNFVLSVSASSPEAGTSVVVEQYRSGRNQLWAVEYKDFQQTSQNEETGEKARDVQIMKPCVKAKKISINQGPEIREASSSTSDVLSECDDTTPPAWLPTYMEKFKKDIVQEMGHVVAKKTVKHVLRGLEGAVITSVRGTSGIPEDTRSTENKTCDDASDPIYSHSGVVCDQCERNIVGVRYKCGNCEDFDLCDECEKMEDVHNPEHVFLKIRQPLQYAGRKQNGCAAPLLKQNLYKSQEQFLQRVQEKADKKEEKLKLKADRMEEKLKRKEGKREEKMKKREEKLKRRLEQGKELPQKKEKLDLPQFAKSMRMDARFIRDISIPDGTHVQPGTKLTKQWLVENTGSHIWTENTKLKVLWGNMEPMEQEFDVLYLTPGEEGTVAVTVIAPNEPGSYQSHWRLSHYGKKFGHRLWCSIIVDAKEILEVADTFSQVELEETEELPLRQKPSIEETDIVPREAPEGATTTIDKAILSPQDFLSFEMLDLRERNSAKLSHTATPNNTPLDVSPPKSPSPELNCETEGLPRSVSGGTSCSGSSVEIVQSDGASTELDNSELMTELVQKRMESLDIKQTHFAAPVDIESISSGSDDDSYGSDEDDDFYIVPIPDCFNPKLPPRQSASTTVYIKKEAVGETRSVDEMLTASGSVEATPLLPPPDECIPCVSETSSITQLKRLAAESAVVQLLEAASLENRKRSSQPAEPDEDEVQIVHVEPATPKLPADTETDKVIVVEDDNVSAEITDEDGPSQTTADDSKDQTNKEQNPGETKEQSAIEIIDDDRDEKDCYDDPRSPGDVVDLLGVVVGAASQAAVSAYSTAKDVFHTLQAKNQYVPPKSNWTPTETTWSPPAKEWSPPARDWSPPSVEQPQTDRPLTPLEQLVEMGFGNRELNKRLLDQYDNDVERVVQELIQNHDNDWHSNRH